MMSFLTLVPEQIEKQNQMVISLDVNIPVQVDFDEVCEAMSKCECPLMVVCEDGDTFSTAFAIAYIMYSFKRTVQVASLIVFSKRNNNAKICKWLYTQLLIYEPQKLK